MATVRFLAPEGSSRAADASSPMPETTSVVGTLSASAAAPTASVEPPEPEPHAVRSSVAEVIRVKGAKWRLRVRVDLCIVCCLLEAEGKRGREGRGARVKAKSRKGGNAEGARP